MAQPSRLTSITTVRAGAAPTVSPTQPAPQVFFERLRELGYAFDDVLILDWATAPRANAGALAKALAQQQLLDAGEPAAVDRGSTHLLGLFVGTGQPELALQAKWPGAAAGVSFALSRSTQGAETGRAVVPETSFTLDVPADTDEAGVRQALAQAAEAPRTQPALDPVALLPDDAAGRIVQTCAARFGRHGDGIDALLGAATVLLLWARMERTNAGTLCLSLDGLSNGDGPMAPNERLSIQATRRGPGSDDEPPADLEERTSARVRWRPH